MPMMNVQLDLTKDNMSPGGVVYSRTNDKKRDSWEIIRARIGEVGAEPMMFESYFRIEKNIEWNECSWKCCHPAGKAYIGVTPKSYFVDEGDVFVSWDGFYKDCDDAGSSENLKWTVGVSKIRNGTSCVLNGGSTKQAFSACTEVVSIVYQNVTGRNAVLPFGGFSSVRMPRSRKRMFFMSVMRSEGIDMGVLSNEVWVFPEGDDFSKNPQLLQTFAPVRIHGLLFDAEIQDGGSIRLHTNPEGVLDHLCRTAFDHSISCFPVRLDETDTVLVRLDEEYVFADSVQIEQTCSVDLFKAKSYLNEAASVTTGLEVQWDSNGEPERVFFGCLGELGGSGNFTAAERNGKIVTTLPGAFPGSIVFGVTLPSNFSSADQEEMRRMPVGRCVLVIIFLMVGLAERLCRHARRSQRRFHGSSYLRCYTRIGGFDHGDLLVSPFNAENHMVNEPISSFLELSLLKT